MNRLPFRIGSNLLNGTGLDPFHTGGSYILSANRLTAHNSGGAGMSLTAKGFSTGLKYMEVLVNSGTHGAFGVANNLESVNNGLGFTVNSWSYLSSPTDGASYKAHGGSDSVYGNLFISGDIIGIALDMTNGFIYFSKNNTWQNSGVPTSGSSGTNAAFGGLTGTLYFAVSNFAGNAGNYTINTGTIAFTYTPPTGYSGF